MSCNLISNKTLDKTLDKTSDKTSTPLSNIKMFNLTSTMSITSNIMIYSRN